MTSLLFLDIDGVLNGHSPLASGYNGILAGPVEQLNRILDATDCRLVISSAWRYQYHNGDMTLKGFEILLLVHGIKCMGRLDGFTERDPVDEEPSHFNPDTWHRLGLKWRVKQIKAYRVASGNVKRWAVVDDLPLVGLRNFVQTEPTVGLTVREADLLIKLLRE